MVNSLQHVLETGNFSNSIIYKFFSIIVSTPTGSTAYNMAAGGSIVQTTVPCICLTPLAPHSLSFRPLILHDSAVITLQKKNDFRNAPWVSLDGATRFQMENGEAIQIKVSQHSIGIITDPQENMTNLWSKRLTELLKWNNRLPLKPLSKEIKSSSEN